MQHTKAPGLPPICAHVCPEGFAVPLCYDELDSSSTFSVPPLTVCLTLQDLSYKDRHWHEGCFHCSRCGSSLVDKPFAAKGEQLLCTDCYSNEYSSKCQECKKTIMPGQNMPFPRAHAAGGPEPV